MSESNEKIRETVRQEYTKIGQGGSCCCGSATPDKLAEGIRDCVVSIDITALKNSNNQCRITNMSMDNSFQKQGKGGRRADQGAGNADARADMPENPNMV